MINTKNCSLSIVLTATGQKSQKSCWRSTASARQRTTVESTFAGLVESNGSLPPGLWLTSPAGWLPGTGISSGTLRSAVEYGLPSPLMQYCNSCYWRCAEEVGETNCPTSAIVCPSLSSFARRCSGFAAECRAERTALTSKCYVGFRAHVIITSRIVS